MNRMPYEADPETHPFYEAARARVSHDPDLRPFADILTAEDYGSPDHFEWVASAPVAELLDWAREQLADAPEVSWEQLDAIFDGSPRN